MQPTTLSTIPPAREVATTAIDTWSIDFTNALHENEVLVSGDAILVGDMSGFTGEMVLGFVTHSEVIDASVFVTWDGSVLRKSVVYNLLTTAILNTGAAITLLTKIKCVA